MVTAIAKGYYKCFLSHVTRNTKIIILATHCLRLGIMRGCPSLVGGRPAKPVVLTGRAGSNPAPRATLDSMLCIVE